MRRGDKRFHPCGVASSARWEFADSRPGRKGVAQLANGLLENGMVKVRCDFSHRLEDKTALVHGGMRNGKGGEVDHSVAKEKDIDVDGARALGLCSLAIAAERPLDLHDGRKELPRHLFRFESYGAVQEPGLVGKVDGLSFVKG